MSSKQNVKQYVRQTFSELAKAEKIGDYERCLKLCAKIIKFLPNDLTVQHCRIVSLMQLQKFNEALSLLTNNPKLTDRCIFEKAYCHYRLNQNGDALKTLNDAGDNGDNFRCRDLRAQLLYRAEEFEDCCALYANLLKHSDDEFDEERRSNLAASVSLLAYDSNSTFASKYVPSQTTYEQVFNEACRLCALERFLEAKKLLIKAEKMCLEFMAENDSTEEETIGEVCCIRLQKAYCQQMLGESEEALKTYLTVDQQKPSDITLLAVAANNIVSIKKDANLNEARRKMKHCHADHITVKLNKIQKSIMCYNNLLVNLNSNQASVMESCRKSIDDLKGTFDDLESAVLCEAILFSRQKDNAKAITLIRNYLGENRSKNSVVMNYALIQFYLNDGKTTEAYDQLKTLIESDLKPGTLSILIALCLAKDDRRTAVEILTESIRKLRLLNADDPQIPVLLEECAALYTNVNDNQTAAKCLEDLRKAKPDDVNILSRLIDIYLRFDVKKAEEVSRCLPDIDRITGDLDVISLENAESLLLGGKYGAKKAAKTEATPKVDGVDTKRKKKKGKIRLPKNYDPNVPPDPERWLPKFERTMFKKRKDKRAKDREISKGTQGAVSGGGEFDSTKLDSTITPKTTAVTSPKAASGTSVPNAAPGPRQQRPAPQKPKKKKKQGGKW